MLQKIAGLTALITIAACQSQDKLIGDSNVYLDTDEPGSNPTVDEPSNENGGGECSASSSLDVQSFQATPSDSEDPTIPGASLGALSCGVDGHAVTIQHHNVFAHCDQSWSDININTEEEFIFKISYGFEPIESSDCAYNLEYTIDLQDCELPPGVYQIIAHGEEAEVDLSYVLGEAETTD